jgi:AcrR family transcriptional regulator
VEGILERVPDVVSVEVVRRKRGRPRDPEADDRILAAASELILQHGFEHMTVDAVAARARVGKATVYRRWAKKEDLAVAAMGQLYRDEMPTPDTGSLRGDLTAAYTSALAFVNSPLGASYLRTTISEAIRDERIAALYQEANEVAERGAFVMFERAIVRGEVRPDIDIAVAVQWLGGLLSARAITGKPMPTLAQVDTLVDFVLHGVGAAR